MAESAKFSSSAGSALSAGVGAMPMLALTVTMLPPMSNGASSAFSTASAPLRQGVGIRDSRQQCDELVPREAGEDDVRRRPVAQLSEGSGAGVELLGRAVQTLSDDALAGLPEHLVAGLVAQRIVDLLESVQVDEQQRALARVRRGGQVAEHMHDDRAIGQAGDGIAVGQHVHAHDVGVQPPPILGKLSASPPTSQAQSTSTGLSKSPAKMASVLRRSARM